MCPHLCFQWQGLLGKPCWQKWKPFDHLKLGSYFRTLVFLLIEKNIFKCTNFAIIKYWEDLIRDDASSPWILFIFHMTMGQNVLLCANNWSIHTVLFLHETLYWEYTVYFIISPVAIYILGTLGGLSYASRESYTLTPLFSSKISGMMNHIYIYMYVYKNTWSCHTAWLWKMSVEGKY